MVCSGLAEGREDSEGDMKLLTKAILEQFERQGDTSEKSAEEIMVIAKFFNPCGAGTWYAYEYNPKYREFMAFVNLIGPDCAECGPVSLDELESVRGPLGLGIERDLYFKPRPLKEIMDTVKAGGHV